MDTSFVILYFFFIYYTVKNTVKKYCRIYRILLAKKLPKNPVKIVNCCKINYSMILQSKLQLIFLCETVIYSIFYSNTELNL